MPTVDDLRAALLERESFAGDVDSVRDALARPRHRSLAPALAAAAVVTVTAGVVVVATHHDASREPAGAGVPSASSTPFTGSAPPATTAPPHQDTALTWGFSVDQIDGFTARYTRYDPYEQVAEVDGDNAFSALVTVHPRGAYTVGDVTGDQVTVDGRSAYWLRDGYVLWEYATDSWATVRTNGSGHSAARRDVSLKIARAVRFGQGAHVRATFALRSLPSRFLVEAASDSGSQSCVGYGTGDAYPTDQATKPEIGTVLSVCRVDDGATIVSSSYAGDRTYTRTLGDGTSLFLAVGSEHLDEISQADLVGFAKHADTSPKLADESTWLPVRS